MASVAISGRRARGALTVQTTRDRDLLRGFLERNRLFAAYALCDLEDREFSRTRWGAALDGDEMIAVALEYSGMTPQPMFVMGRDDGIEAILRDVIRPRAAYVAALTESMPAVQTQYQVDPGPPMVRMWVDKARFRPYPGGRPTPAADRDRRAEPALPARFRVVAPVVVDRRGRLLRDPRRRPARRRGGHPRHQPPGTPRRRRQRPDPYRLSWPRLRDGRHRRGDGGAAADLRPGRAQRPLRQPARPPGLSAARLCRARPVRGTARPPAGITLARSRGADPAPPQPQGA